MKLSLLDLVIGILVLAIVSIARAPNAAEPSRPPTVFRGANNPDGHGLSHGLLVAPPSCVERFIDLPLLARRLGVVPNANPEGAIILRMCDGTTYSLVELISRTLDRLDAAEKRHPLPYQTDRINEDGTIEPSEGRWPKEKR